MSLVETYHAAHKARMARLSPKPKVVAPPPVARPAAKLVIAKPAPVIPEKSYYPQMWFWELVNFIPRRVNSSVTCHVGPRVEHIQKIVCKSYGISRTDILADRRTAAVVRPRQVAMYVSKELTTQSLPEIGRRFGGKDHTTVLHAVRKITALVATDPILAAKIDDIKAECLT